MKINCICCGHTIDLHDAYDDYEGPIRCFTCGGFLEIKTQGGQVRTVRFCEGPARIQTKGR